MRPQDRRTPVEPPPEGVFRLPLWLRFVSNVPLVLLAGFIVPPGLEGGAVSITFRLLAALFMLAVIMRSLQLKVVLGDAVTIVNWRRTREYPWSDVEIFGHDRTGLWMRRRSKERVAVAAFNLGRPLPWVKRHSETAVQAMEEIRKKRRGPGRGTGRGRKR